MTKKDMVEILVEQDDFSKSELNEMSKSEVENLFNELYEVEEEKDEYGTSENTFGLDDKEDLSVAESKVENKIIDEKPKLSKGEQRILRRAGKL